MKDIWVERQKGGVLMWQTPKTDWMSVDVYLAEDLNRVEGNTKYLRNKLLRLGYFEPEITTKTNWTQEDVLFAEDFNRIENNIKKIADVYFTNSEFEALKTNWVPMDSVDYTFSNRVEKNLKILYEMIWGMKKRYVYCGVGRLGRVRTYQNGWRCYND